jgi:hypothetical protein
MKAQIIILGKKGAAVELNCRNTSEISKKICQDSSKRLANANRKGRNLYIIRRFALKGLHTNYLRIVNALIRKKIIRGV